MTQKKVELKQFHIIRQHVIIYTKKLCSWILGDFTQTAINQSSRTHVRVLNSLTFFFLFFINRLSIWDMYSYVVIAVVAYISFDSFSFVSSHLKIKTSFYNILRFLIYSSRAYYEQNCSLLFFYYYFFHYVFLSL